MSTSNLQSAATSLKYNVLLQIVMKLITFTMTAVCIRHLSPETIGVGNVRLMLLKLTSICIVRETFRKACMTIDCKSNYNVQQLVNLVWLSVPLSASIAALLTYIWIYMLSHPDPSTVPNYVQSVIVMSVTVPVEFLVEPIAVILQVHLYVRIKVLVESSLFVVSGAIMVGLVIFCPHIGAYMFAITHTMASIMYILGYVVFAVYKISFNRDNFPITSLHKLLPSKPHGGLPWFDPRLLGLIKSLLTQSLIKQFLSNGEQYVMTMLDVASFKDQGVYDVVTNLGSIVARIIFLPLEESAYQFFAQTLKREAKDKQTNSTLKLASDFLQLMLRFVLLIGLVCITFGYSYSRLALFIYGGKGLSEGVGVLLLQVYSLYILFIATNGITEAFMFATMDSDQVKRYNYKLLLFSAVFLLSSVVLASAFGTVGLLIANLVNMGLRIVQNCRFIHGYFSGSAHRPLSSLNPGRLLVGLVLVTGIVTAYTETLSTTSLHSYGTMVHLFAGIALLLGDCFVAGVFETEVLAYLRQYYVPVSFKKMV